MSFIVTLQPDPQTRIRHGWIGHYTFTAIVADQPSPLGIEGGRVLTLTLHASGRVVAAYGAEYGPAGWYTTDTQTSRKDILRAIVDAFPNPPAEPEEP